ncbi:MAG: hypothetical protein QM811_10435 [Pirellulales bacterium]
MRVLPSDGVDSVGGDHRMDGPGVVREVLVVRSVVSGVALRDGLVIVFAMVVVLAVDRRANDLIANEDDERFQQIPEPTLRDRIGTDVGGQASEEQDQQAGDDHFDDHELRDAEAGFGFVQILRRAERLRNEDLAGQFVLVIVDRPMIFGFAFTYPVRELLELFIRVVIPKRLRHFEIVAVLDV